MVAPYDPSLQLDCSPMIPVVIGGTQYIRDFSGYGRHGTPTGFAGTDVEYEDGAGQGQVISISTPKYVNHGQILNYTFEDFSFEIAFMANSLANEPVLLYKGTDNVNGYYIQARAGGQIQLATSQGGAAQYTQSSAGSLTLNIYHHIIVVRSSAIGRTYLNGRETGYTAVGVHINPLTSASDFQVGRYAANAALDLNGRINRYRSYNRAIGAAEAKEKYQLWNRGV